jgi:hypothetical protein
MKSINLVTRRIRAKFLEVGIGGFDCPCCSPPKKDIKRAGRMARHRMNRDIMDFEYKAEGV